MGRTPFKHCLRRPSIQERLGLPFLVVLGMTILVSCSDTKELSRSKVQKLLDSSERFTPKQSSLILSKQEVDCGLQGGLWARVGPWGNLMLTPKGAAEFSSVSARGDGGGALGLKKPVKRHVVEIQGIRDWPGSEGKQKYAEFSWSFDMDDWSSIAKSCFPPPPPKNKGQAMFALYDDGWRLDRVD
jgi:hypothetical protein